MLSADCGKCVECEISEPEIEAIIPECSHNSISHQQPEASDVEEQTSACDTHGQSSQLIIDRSENTQPHSNIYDPEAQNKQSCVDELDTEVQNSQFEIQPCRSDVDTKPDIDHCRSDVVCANPECTTSEAEVDSIRNIQCQPSFEVLAPQTGTQVSIAYTSGTLNPTKDRQIPECEQQVPEPPTILPPHSSEPATTSDRIHPNLVSTQSISPESLGIDNLSDPLREPTTGRKCKGLLKKTTYHQKPPAVPTFSAANTEEKLENENFEAALDVEDDPASDTQNKN